VDSEIFLERLPHCIGLSNLAKGRTLGRTLAQLWDVQAGQKLEVTGALFASSLS